MYLLADANLPELDSLVAVVARQSGLALQLERFGGRLPSAEQLARAEAMFIRSVTKVDAQLLAQAPKLRWLGSATIGTDHVDQAAVQAAGLSFHSTPGVNANAVGDYVASAAAALALQRGGLPEGEVAIVGAGNTGRAAGQRLAGLGLSVHYYDPPLLEQGSSTLAVHDDWQRVLNSQVISCHVPLQREGPHPTWHMFDAEALAQLAPGAWLINASRGPVIAEQALLNRLQQQSDLDVVLDVWEHEPQISAALLPYLQLATPHIAGHSLAGKLGGSWQLLNKWLTDQQLSLQLPSLATLLGRYPQGQIQGLRADKAPDWQQLAHWILRCYDIRKDDAALRAVPCTPAEFDALRAQYAVRSELNQLHLSTGDWADSVAWQQRLAQLTFQTATQEE
ncbi:4-phosphoerythronate dehydrogenase [Pseudidiomarina sp. 1APP75-27a]|uniref:4-phosphoerythronate dehydrogenase n=1 Tax=Pseudidiomarina terrestris TaxID=2820060 RepID=UPI002B05E92E|nr:4-phosphoerythronate dehydrogenase [Pseudidiomarina sp. 1APP75-27a]MEA3587490.1 4-phosphoerythronate dehydrogenase [Pseudidiomarina sp. 1APP75-27a]